MSDLSGRTVRPELEPAAFSLRGPDGQPVTPPVERRDDDEQVPVGSTGPHTGGEGEPAEVPDVHPVDRLPLIVRLERPVLDVIAKRADAWSVATITIRDGETLLVLGDSDMRFRALITHDNTASAVVRIGQDRATVEQGGGRPITGGAEVEMFHTAPVFAGNSSGTDCDIYVLVEYESGDRGRG